GSAIYRNKAKRRLRSIAMKVLLKHAKWGHEYVLIARRSTNSVDFDSLTRELEHCLKKLNAYRK
ncbi:MAG: ribonuclease P protein component, partial [Pseudomonadota bacterium]|nr:ribonuclease P protein component [Pseudomonadota bacterium]